MVMHLAVKGKTKELQPLCGQRGKVTASREIEQVTCKKCRRLHEAGDGPESLKAMFRF